MSAPVPTSTVPGLFTQVFCFPSRILVFPPCACALLLLLVCAAQVGKVLYFSLARCRIAFGALCSTGLSNAADPHAFGDTFGVRSLMIFRNFASVAQPLRVRGGDVRTMRLVSGQRDIMRLISLRFHRWSRKSDGESITTTK